MIYTTLKKPLPASLNSVEFEARSNAEITEDQALDAQTQLGYNPMGYGFYRFTCRKTDNGSYEARWFCSNSAD